MPSKCNIWLNFHCHRRREARRLRSDFCQAGAALAVSSLGTSSSIWTWFCGVWCLSGVLEMIYLTSSSSDESTKVSSIAFFFFLGDCSSSLLYVVKLVLGRFCWRRAIFLLLSWSLSSLDDCWSLEVQMALSSSSSDEDKINFVFKLLLNLSKDFGFESGFWKAEHESLTKKRKKTTYICIWLMCARASLDWFHQLAKVFAFGLDLKSLADLVVVHKPANRPKSCNVKLGTFNCNAIMAMEAPTTYTSFRTMAYELSCSNNTSLCKSQTSCLLILFPLLVIDEQAAKRKSR